MSVRIARFCTRLPCVELQQSLRCRCLFRLTLGRSAAGAQDLIAKQDFDRKRTSVVRSYRADGAVLRTLAVSLLQQFL